MTGRIIFKSDAPSLNQMPYIPDLGKHGRLHAVHAGIHSAISRTVESQAPRPLPPLDDNSLTMQSLSDSSSYNATALYNMEQERVRHIVATTTSSVSLAASFIAVFWFFMMRRNFRRDLVLLLILGGAWKSFWFVLFSVYSITQGTVQTESGLCQATGYFLQVGFESCDIAVLFMSMHMYFQIFPTARFGLGHDGLYRVRRWVYAFWLIFPNVTAAIAFANPGPAYMAQGGFCSLPLRPYWYRVALFWGPRYLVWCYVIFVAVSIYRYVGSEFKVFGEERDRSESLGVPGNSSVDRMMKAEMEKAQEKQHRLNNRLSSLRVGGADGNDEDNGEYAPDDTSMMSRTRPKATAPDDSPKLNESNNTRRQSMPTWNIGMGGMSEDSTTITPPSQSYPGSRRGSQQVVNGVISEDFVPPLPPPRGEASGHRGSITSLASKKSSGPPSVEVASGLTPIAEGLSAPPDMDRSRPTASAAMNLRRRLIQRQLRLLFIYPCIYMLFWVLPLIANIMNYTDYFAEHPLFAFGIIQLVCVTIMTFADVVIFCWRERPWKHIPGSDGTFLGSLKFWEYCFGSTWAQDRRQSRAPSYLADEKDLGNEKANSRTGLLGSLKRLSMSLKTMSPRGSDASNTVPKRSTHRRNYSGGSDRKHMEAERAHERLALERADYEQNRRSLHERRVSIISQLQSAQPAQERKEWFDQDHDLFTDNDHGPEVKGNSV